MHYLFSVEVTSKAQSTDQVLNIAVRGEDSTISVADQTAVHVNIRGNDVTDYCSPYVCLKE